jgi:two-component system, OmpR family, phosphate regulon sensor histidine kinase PhoR
MSTWGLYFLVAIPTLLILTCGILILVYQQSIFDVVMGLLLVLFCAALGAGAALTLAGIQRDRRLAALQIDFVSKVSHELKTPLTSIRMFVETLELGRVKDPEKVQQCLAVIAKETDRLSVLIGRLLSWGAMEAGAFKVELVPTQPADVVRTALDVFQPQVMRASAQVEVQVPEDLPLVRADHSALVDALLNLLTNALRYGGDAKKIEVSAKRRPDEKLEISVRDWGLGIDLKHQRRIFDRFYRADERYSRTVGGTGLGLAIARHIVQAHGGTIEVKSKIGEGSTFTVVLPITEAPAS